MKSKITRFIVCVFSLALVGGVGGTCFADNAAEVVIQVSYPSGNDYVAFYNGALAAVTVDNYVNVHITLLDANGDPATAGPAGEDLSGVIATLTTDLGIASSIVEDQFLSDSADLTFDVVDVGPAARAHVRYACITSCVPGTDTLEVTVDSLTDSVEVDVRSPAAASLMTRTLNVPGVRPADLFEDLSLSPFTQRENAGVDALAGSDIYFEVWAVEANGDFTFAPELDGAEVTVNAYADYVAQGNVGNPTALEGDPVATTTAEFSGGVATGNIPIDVAGTKDDETPPNPRLKVILTAISGKVKTTQIKTNPATTDPSIDWVGMKPKIKDHLVIGKEKSGYGNLVEEVDTWYVLDDNTTGPTTNAMMVFLVDEFGNPVTQESATIKSTISGPSPDVAASLVDANDVMGGTGNAWQIQSGVPGNTNPGLATLHISGSDNQQELTGGGSAGRGKPLEFTLTLEETAVPQIELDTATVWLVRTDKTNGTQSLDLRLDTDKPASVVTAGAKVTLYIMSASATSYEYPTTSEIVEYNDSLKIVVFECDRPTSKLLISRDTQTYVQATDELELNAPAPTSGTKEIRIPIKIWGACTQDDVVSVCVTLEDTTKGIGVDTPIPLFDAARSITDLQPAVESKIKVDCAKLPADIEVDSDDCDADPIVITSQFVAGVATDLLTPGSIDTADAYDNVIDNVPTYGINSDIGTAFVYATRGASITFDDEDVGETATVTVAVGTLPDRELQIINIVGSAVAGSLMCTLEGPAEPTPGGEAIIQVKANGTFTPASRDVQIGIDTENSVENSEIRDFSGVALISPTTESLASDSMVRLVVSAPEEGDVVIEVGDDSGEPVLLDTGTCTISFGAACTAVVSIDPDGAELLVGQTKQFNASTDCEEPDTEPETPCYTWEIMAGGTTVCTGSTIDNDGLYEAPESGDCTDTIKVTDGCNGDATDTAQVVVSDCTPTVAITPASAGPLETDETEEFCAATTCGGTSREGTYTWSVAGGTATTDDVCITYTAGSTDGTYDVVVTDTANGNITDTATVEISNEPEKSITISPDPMQKGSLIGLWNLMTIEGTNTNFAVFSTTVSFDPDAAIFELFPLILGPTNIWQLVQVNPTWIAGEGPQTVTVTVTTDTEVVTGTFEIELLFGE